MLENRRRQKRSSTHAVTEALQLGHPPEWTVMIARILSTFIAFSGIRVMANDLTPEAAGRFAKLALACVHREYPNKIAHVLNSDADVKAPRDLTPAFHGC